MITLNAILVLSAILFAVGLAGALTRKNAILVLVSVEIMMNAATLNFIGFWRAGLIDLSGPLFALFTLVIAIYRHFKSVDVANIHTLQG